MASSLVRPWRFELSRFPEVRSGSVSLLRLMYVVDRSEVYVQIAIESEVRSSSAIRIAEKTGQGRRLS